MRVRAALNWAITLGSERKLSGKRSFHPWYHNATFESEA